MALNETQKTGRRDWLDESPMELAPRGAAAIAHYVKMRRRAPLKGLGESVHHIHHGTEFEAELRFSDLEKSAEIHAKLVRELVDILQWATVERIALRHQEIDHIRSILKQATGEV